MSEISVDIDRIVLAYPGVTPDRAEHIRTAVEVKLQRLLERSGLPEGLKGGHITSLDVQTVRPAESMNDDHLVGSLAQNIVKALQGVR